MIKYPNGSKMPASSIKNATNPNMSSYSNRGMDLEDDINSTLEYYVEKDIAIITKRPTPINIVKVDYSHGARITDAYFEKQSTTDYNGIYKSRYIDFEAKRTLSTTSFPLHNITPHQIVHLERVIRHGGIAFFVICFSKLDKYYLLDANFVINFYKNEKRQSIPLKTIEDIAVEIKTGFIPRLHLIEAIDEVYFNEKIPAHNK